MCFLNRTLLLRHPRKRRGRRPLNRALLTRTRRMCGRWDSEARELRWPGLTLASVGPITRSNLIIAAGTESRPITITIGTIPSMTALEILAVMIRPSLVMITVMALILSALRLATTVWATRLGWRPAQDGSAATTWTRVTAHRPDTSSAWNGSLRLTLSAAARATRLGLPMSRVTRGFVRLRKAVRLIRCKPLSKLKPQLGL